MIGTCIHSTGAGLGVSHRMVFYRAETEFHVTVGSVYPILGMGLWDATLIVLVCDDTGNPGWLPIGAFEIEPSALPSGWAFELIDGIAASGGSTAYQLAAVWGYAALIQDPGHVDGLANRSRDALKIFFDELAKRTRSV
jgi:hypothetical protein